MDDSLPERIKLHTEVAFRLGPQAQDKSKMH